MNPTIEPIAGATLGAVITGIDLNRLGGQAWRAVEDAFLEYAVLVFPAQHLGAGAQVAFGKRFGAIELLREDNIEAPLFSNKNLDGSLLQPDDFHFQVLRGNEGWHMDSTYMPLAAKAGLLSAIKVPATGGETEFADMRAAWDALDAATRDRIAGRTGRDPTTAPSRACCRPPASPAIPPPNSPPPPATSAPPPSSPPPRIASLYSSPWRNTGCIRAAMHPGRQRCSSLTYGRYARSSRLASRAPHRSRCDAGFHHGLLGDQPGRGLFKDRGRTPVVG